MESLLVKYGYALLFGGVAVEGEAVLLAAGLLARHGFFRLPVVILIAVAANTFADQFYFRLARQRGRAWVEKRFGQHRHFQSLMERMGRHAFPLLLVSRFAYGLRIAIPAACGVVGMGTVAFTLVDLLAGVLWAVPIGLLGYSAGGGLAPILASVQRYEVAIAVVLLGAAGAWLGLRHARRVVRWRELGFADAAAVLHALVPFVIGLMGVLNLVSAIWPREPGSCAELEPWLPLDVMQRSRPFMLFAGVALLQVARNLSRRKALAWWVAVAALAVSFVSHLGHAFDLHHSMVAALLLAYLLVYRRRFQARSDPASLRRALLMAPVLGALVWSSARSVSTTCATSSAGTRATPRRSRPSAPACSSSTPASTPSPSSPRASWARSRSRAGPRGSTCSSSCCGRSCCGAGWRRRPRTVARLAGAHGRCSLASFAARGRQAPPAAWPTGRASWPTPCGAAWRWPPAIRSARQEELRSARPATTSSTAGATAGRRASTRPPRTRCPSTAPSACARFKMAEEAVDRPARLQPGRRQAGRPAGHGQQGAKQGLRSRRYDRAADADAGDRRAARGDLAASGWPRSGSARWASRSRASRSRPSTRSRVPLHGRESRVVAFCSWRPYAGGRAVVLDLMRKRHGRALGDDGPPARASLEELRDLGLDEASLANAPARERGRAARRARAGVALLFEKLNGFYGYKSLFQFKKKFAPRWEGRYLVYPGAPALPRRGGLRGSTAASTALARPGGARPSRRQLRASPASFGPQRRRPRGPARSARPSGRACGGRCRGPPRPGCGCRRTAARTWRR